MAGQGKRKTSDTVRQNTQTASSIKKTKTAANQVQLIDGDKEKRRPQRYTKKNSSQAQSKIGEAQQAGPSNPPLQQEGFSFGDCSKLKSQLNSRHPLSSNSEEGDHRQQTDDQGSNTLASQGRNTPDSQGSSAPYSPNDFTEGDEGGICYVNALPSVIFNLDLTDPSVKNLFERDVAHSVYTKNAFPNITQAQRGATEIGLKYFTDEIDANNFTYLASDELRSTYQHVVTSRRSTSNRQVYDFLPKFKFPRDTFPTESAGDKDDQYCYLLSFARFARADYVEYGALLENQLISHTIHHVYFNKNGQKGPRLSPSPEMIPAQMIVLVYVMLFLNLAKEIQHPLYTENSSLSLESFWCDLYFDTLSGNTTDSKSIDWDRVCQYHTANVQKLQKRGKSEWSTDSATKQTFKHFEEMEMVFSE